MRYSFLTLFAATSLLCKSAAGDDAMDECMGLSGTLQLESNPLLEFSYKVVLDDPEEYNDAAIAFPNGDLTAELVLHRGGGWIGMGMSKDFFQMIPGEVVIGLPASDNSSPSIMQYDLSAKLGSGVNAAGSQTLTDTECVQNSTHTILTFTQRLVQDGRLSFDVKNPNNFIYAIGSSNTLGYHQRKGTFTTDLRVCEPGTGLLPIPTTPPISPITPSKSGKEPVELEDGSICVEGYIMDKWCIETLGYLLDRGRNFPTLETADQHSVHCLADVGVCINSGYEVLTVERGSDGRFGRQVTLDQYGNEATRALSLQVEKEGQLTGFRATVVGTWDDTVQDDPPVLKVNQVFRSEVGCDGPMPTTSEPGLPPPPPTSAPVVNGQEDITMGETDCTGLTARVQIRQNPLVELSYTAVLDDPEGYEEATLPNGNITAELVLHRGEGWIGMGISGSYPNMIPGEVVIGLPDASSVMQYDLSSRSLSGVNAAADGQQLTDTNIVQNSTHTVLTFTRRLVEEGRLPFDANEENGLIWAVGFDNELGYHQFKGTISLNLLVCVPGRGIFDNDLSSDNPSLSPTPFLSVTPTMTPSIPPRTSVSPSSISPTALPSVFPSFAPIVPTSASPSSFPSVAPTNTPSNLFRNSVSPSTISPTALPSVFPSFAPIVPTSASPSTFPSLAPTNTPSNPFRNSVSPSTISPTALPSVSPSLTSIGPTATPPSAFLSVTPTPSVFPSVAPTVSSTGSSTSGTDPIMTKKLGLSVLSLTILSWMMN